MWGTLDVGLLLVPSSLPVLVQSEGECEGADRCDKGPSPRSYLLPIPVRAGTFPGRNPVDLSDPDHALRDTPPG